MCAGEGRNGGRSEVPRQFLPACLPALLRLLLLFVGRDGVGAQTVGGGAAEGAVEEFLPVTEVPLEEQADALCGEGGLGEVAVVGLVVALQADVAGGGEEPLDVEVAHEVGVGELVVAVAEVAVDEEAVVQEASGEHALDFHVRPALVARAEVGAEVPLAAVDDVGEHVVELSRQGRREEGVHGGRLGAVVDVGVGVVVGVEAADAQEVDDLHLHLLVGADVALHQFAFFLADVGQLEVEVQVGRGELAGEVEQAVDLGGVLREGGVGREVFQGRRVDGVDGLQVDVAVLGSSAEGDAAAGLEEEVLADDFLEAELVKPVVEGVGAVELELALVVVACLEVAAALRAGVVARQGVHDDLDGGVGGDVQLGVDVDVGRAFVLLLVGLFGHGVAEGVGDGVVLPLGVGSLVDEGDELVAGYFFGRPEVVDEGGVLAGAQVGVHVQAAVVALQGGDAGAVDAAVDEGILALGCVVEQHVVGVEGEAVAQVAQVVVREGAFHLSGVSVLVGHACLTEFDGAGEQTDGVELQVVGGVEYTDVDAGVAGGFAFEIQVGEGSVQAYVARDASRQVAEHARGVHVEELQVGAIGGDVEVQPRLGWGDPTLHRGAGMAGGVADVGVEMDVALLGVPQSANLHVAHVAVVEGEVADAEVGVERGALHRLRHDCLSAGEPAEVDGMELDDVEDVLQADVIEVDTDGVVLVFCQLAVDVDVLRPVFKAEVVDDDPSGVDVDDRRAECPGGVVDDDVRGENLDACARVVVLRVPLTEACHGGELAAVGAFGVVAPVEEGLEFVVACLGLQREVQHGVALHLLREPHQCLQPVLRIVDEHHARLVTLALVAEGREIALDFHLVVAFVEVSLDGGGHTDVERDAEHLLQHLGVRQAE